ncbi:MAG: type IV toxin-antitoxin system AbiEi family antitoxin domain-containing protein [Pseudomonadota bacterium]|nr:type IV toxin-antitoxin system AbiEi family antitoxin domain-containing protein [Pseudomonadota bacterium]
MKMHGMARLRELMAEGVTAATVTRMERAGTIVRLARGLYQLPDAPVDSNHTLAQVAKLVPRGVVCLASALAFHGLTDQLPAKVWIALGAKERRPAFSYPPVRFVRFPDDRLTVAVRRHVIDGVGVPIFNVAKTVVDVFRYRRTVGVSLALEGLREALRQKKATPAEIARLATKAKVWPVMEPYVMALTADG